MWISRPKYRAARSCLAAAGGALALAMQGAVAAPGAAEVDACLEESGAVRACASKELSNVIVQCGDESGSFFVKYDQLDGGSYEGLIDPYSGFFTCPSGEVIAVFIKSGRNFYDGDPIEGLPPGAGAQWEPAACSEDPADCGSDEGDVGGDEGGDENSDPRE